MRHQKKNIHGSGTDELATIMGSATGNSEHATLAGGWAGTDDATSTAPSDQLGNPPTPEEDLPFEIITRDFYEKIQFNDLEQAEDEERIDKLDESIELADAKENPNGKVFRLKY